jgi:hypothetical protein
MTAPVVAFPSLQRLLLGRVVAAAGKIRYERHQLYHPAAENHAGFPRFDRMEFACLILIAF